MGATIGVFKGLMYQDSPKGGSTCFGALAGQLASFDAFGQLMTKCYMPWYWSEVMVNFQDLNANLSGFYVSCKMDKLFYSLARLGSLEGITGLATRGGGSVFQIMSLTKAFKDPTTSTMALGRSVGKLGGAIIDFKI